jgi:alkylation response protein AidB-like acyl-CoA dehydrogenase
MPSLKDADRHIVDSVGGLLDDAGGLGRVRRLQSDPLSFDRKLWMQFAAQGWLGASVPEEKDGVGLTLGEIALLLETAGRRLMPEPLSLTLASARLLAQCEWEASASLLNEVITGSKVATVILPEPLVDSQSLFLADAAGQLSGVGGYLSDGHFGEVFLLPILVHGEARLYGVSRTTPGVVVESDETVDGGSITRLRFEGMRLADAAMLAQGPAIVAAVGEATDLMRLFYAALLVGLMDEALQITVSYLKDRRQFGVPIGSFQALQHRVASLYVVVHGSRAFLYEACKADAERRSVAALGAKAYAAQSAMQTVRECVQLHGAMGYTEEHNMSLFFRRAMSLAAAGGDPVLCRKLLYAQREKIRDS